MTKPILAERLRAARQALTPELTQRDIAKFVDRSASAVNLWEAGKTEPGASELVALCQKYKVSADWLLGLAETKAHVIPHRMLNTVPMVPEAEILDGHWEKPQADRLQTMGSYPHGAACQVRSESLKSICPPGSFAVLTPATMANDGQVVMAMTHQGAAVIRRLIRDGGLDMLVADDTRYPTINLHDAGARIVGLVREVIIHRTLN
jgi:transcriptional regulator with XRE-family HTH domain